MAGGAGVIRRLAIAACLLAMLAACGKVGPPSPPGPPDQITYPGTYPAH
jgi:predicted small lipoprotein YifL